MREVRSMVEQGNGEQLYDYFRGAKQFRDTLPIRSKGAIPSFYDLYVDILDRTGVVSHITTLLAIKKISALRIFEFLKRVRTYTAYCGLASKRKRTGRMRSFVSSSTDTEPIRRCRGDNDDKIDESNARLTRNVAGTGR
ncbi:hypothetical protein GCM10020331_067610 [Ectobacillus funiculus]